MPPMVDSDCVVPTPYGSSRPAYSSDDVSLSCACASWADAHRRPQPLRWARRSHPLSRMRKPSMDLRVHVGMVLELVMQHAAVAPGFDGEVAFAQHRSGGARNAHENVADELTERVIGIARYRRRDEVVGHAVEERN